LISGGLGLVNLINAVKFAVYPVRRKFPPTHGQRAKEKGMTYELQNQNTDSGRFSGHVKNRRSNPAEINNFDLVGSATDAYQALRHFSALPLRPGIWIPSDQFAATTLKMSKSWYASVALPTRSNC